MPMHATYSESFILRLLFSIFLGLIAIAILNCGVIFIVALEFHPLAFVLAVLPIAFGLRLCYCAIRLLTDKWFLKIDDDTLYIQGWYQDWYRVQQIPLRQIASVAKEEQEECDESGNKTMSLFIVMRDHSDTEFFKLSAGGPGGLRFDEFMEAVRHQVALLNETKNVGNFA